MSQSQVSQASQAPVSQFQIQASLHKKKAKFQTTENKPFPKASTMSRKGNPFDGSATPVAGSPFGPFGGLATSTANSPFGGSVPPVNSVFAQLNRSSGPFGGPAGTFGSFLGTSKTPATPKSNSPFDDPRAFEGPAAQAFLRAAYGGCPAGKFCGGFCGTPNSARKVLFGEEDVLDEEPAPTHGYNLRKRTKRS